MRGAIRWLLSTEPFAVRTDCGTGWSTALVAASVLSDVAILMCYLGIPATLAVLYRAAHKSGKLPELDAVSVAATLAFVVSCGLTHAMDALMFFWPAYRLTALALVCCAFASVSALSVFATRMWMEARA